VADGLQQIAALEKKQSLLLRLIEWAIQVRWKDAVVAMLVMDII
jgi:hypothetical protein